MNAPRVDSLHIFENPYKNYEQNEFSRKVEDHKENGYVSTLKSIGPVSADAIPGSKVASDRNQEATDIQGSLYSQNSK